MSSPDSQDRPAKAKDDLDHGPAPGSLESADFWDVVYGRRSVRRFRSDPVPRELTDKVLHAGIWAPSSCNYQMWDVVAVDDAELNRELAQLSTQMGNAPVNLVVSYGRDFSEEGSANIQSASAMIQNMSLAAHALGLGTFWITQMGDNEKLREKVGLPYDRLVIAVLALGYPEKEATRAPARAAAARAGHALQPVRGRTDPLFNGSSGLDSRTARAVSTGARAERTPTQQAACLGSARPGHDAGAARSKRCRQGEG